MKTFKLPDLGEGLAEAEIVQWHVREGDTVAADQTLVSVETAKAIVEVPSPWDGTIARLYGQAGDIIHTGEPLVAFEGEDEDAGTVVGELERSDTAPQEDRFIIGAPESSQRARRQRATPGVRALAERLGVNLEQVTGSGPGGLVTRDDVHRQASRQQALTDAQPLRGVRRTMARNMAYAHARVVPASLFEDADVHAWEAGTDITMRLVRGLASACEAEPALNAWFDGDGLTRRLMDEVHVGIAVDTPDGLFVPVLRDVNHRDAADLRRGLENLRAAVASREIPPEEMQGATITLSNFGPLAGRYANPVVSPPQVAIVGAGRLREQAVADRGDLTVHRVLPLSLTFDHRAVTGGEAARFLAAMIGALQSP